MNHYLPIEERLYSVLKRIFIQMSFDTVSRCSSIENNFVKNLVKYIYNIDGLTGLYRGFGCSVLSKMVCWYATTQIDQVNIERQSIDFFYDVH